MRADTHTHTHTCTHTHTHTHTHTFAHIHAYTHTHMYAHVHSTHTHTHTHTYTHTHTHTRTRTRTRTHTHTHTHLLSRLPSLVECWWEKAKPRQVSLSAVMYMFDLASCWPIVANSRIHAAHTTPSDSLIIKPYANTNAQSDPSPFLSSPSSYLRTSHVPPFFILSPIWANGRHPDGCFGLLALISAVQPSKTRLLNLFQAIPTPTGPSNLIPLDYLTAPTL